ncbi:rubrerythrin [Patescibacteria group bacterium]
MQETIKNLAKAFIGESQARNRYTLYAKVALKEGYEQISDIFLKTAEQEREHASWLFKLIKQLKEKQGNPEELNELTVEAACPTVYATTAENLKAAIAGENYEYTEMYPDFADVAEKEGLTDIAVRLRSIAKAENHHEERYLKLLKEVEAGTVFEKEEEVEWTCRKCGFVHKGKTPPKKCPSCDHEKEFYEIKCETY